MSTLVLKFVCIDKNIFYEEICFWFIGVGCALWMFG